MSEAKIGVLAVGACTEARSSLRVIVGDTVPSISDIRTELQRVIASMQFDASERNRRFLCYVVEETLAQRADRIKAYTIATTVFGRDVDFDPQIDPVVRMEAQRLRRSLERFYLTDGRHDPVRIFLPKGAYIPEFRIAASLPPKPSRDWTAHDGDEADLPSILVRPFDIEAEGPGCRHGETGLCYQLMIALTRNAEWHVFSVERELSQSPASEERAATAGDKPHFILMGSKAVSVGSMHVKAVLLDARTGRVVWGRSFEQAIQSHDIFATRDAIASAIVRALPRANELAGRKLAEYPKARPIRPEADA